MPARLQAGQPPLRLSEFAVMCGVVPATVRKWWDAGELAFVTLPVSGEKRVPVDAAVSLLRRLRVIE